MGPSPHVRIKICCISSAEEARLAVAAGADALGLVSAMPSGPGVIDEGLIAEIGSTVPPPVATFLLTSQQDVEAIVRQQRRTRVTTLQLCDRLDVGMYEDLRQALPGTKLVQVIHVVDDRDFEEALEVAPFVDALLLDSGNRSLAVKELGGTGRIHDWEISRRIRESVNVPVFLAGGLRADNVGDAIALVQPFAVDVCSGVRSDGRLDPERLRRFVDAVRRADALPTSRPRSPSPGVPSG